MIRAAGFAAAVGAAAIAACTPSIQSAGPKVGPAALAGDAVRTPDGVRLPLKIWPARGRVRAVVVALHGMNEHKGTFALPAATWRERGIAVYAYDQRGFGAAPRRGIWPGVRLLVGDFGTVIRLVRARHPGVPVFALGVSMGGAVLLAALGRPNAPAVDGVILSAPAVWARETMPESYRLALRLAARTIPWAQLSASGLGRRPTDNLAVWRATARDPLLLRGARVDAVWGVANLMDAAWVGAPKVGPPVLFLYGAHDEIIPKQPVAKLLARLGPRRYRFAYYPHGWHWLFRDLDRWEAHDDVSAWVLKRTPPGSRPTPPGGLPSGADRRALARLHADIAKDK